MQRLFDAATAGSGYYTDAAGAKWGVGGSAIANDAGVIGGFALASLASSDTPPSAQQLINFGAKTMVALPPTVQNSIAKMFNPQNDTEKKQIYAALALLYLLDSLKAIAVAPSLDANAKKAARQRWVVTQRYLQSLAVNIRKIYNRLLRFIHIPHYGPRITKAMYCRWLAAVNNRSRPWGRSKAFHALPQMPSTKTFNATATWNAPFYDSPRPAYKRKSAGASKGPAAKKSRTGKTPAPSIWAADAMMDVGDAIPEWGAPAVIDEVKQEVKQEE